MIYPQSIFKGEVFRKVVPDFAASMLLLLVTVYFFFPVLFDDKTFFFRDVVKYIIPEKFFIAASFKEGAWPFWNNAVFSGTPFLALMNPSPTYPLYFLFAGGDFISGFNHFMVANHLILVLSVYGLIRFWGASCSIALTSAMMAALGGYYLSLFSLGNHYLSMVWTPLILLTFQKFLLCGKTRFFLLAVVFLTFQVLGGSPETCILSTVLLYFSSVYLVPGEASIKGFWPRTLTVGGLVLFAFGLSAFQLLPTYSLVQHSVRDWGLTLQSSVKWSLDPNALTSLVFPKDLAGFMEKTNQSYSEVENLSFLPSIFMGTLPAFFLCSGVFLFKTKEIRFWTIVFFTGIFFALGSHNPVYPFLFSWVPLLDMFRYPEKFYFLSAFSLVFLTAFWLKAFTRTSAEGKYKMRPLLYLALLLAVGMVGIAVWIHWRNAIMSFICIFALVFACRLFYSGSLNAEGFKWTVLALLFLDLMTRNYMLVPMIDRDFYDKEPALVSAVGKYEAGYRVYSGPINQETIPDRSGFPGALNRLLSHIYEKERLFPKLGTIYGLEYAEGSLGVELKDTWLWVELFGEFSPEKRIRMLERCNVKYWITPEDDAITSHSDSPVLLKKVEILNGVLPRAFIVNKVRQDHHAHKTYFEENFDPLSEVLLYQSVSIKTREDFEGRVEEIIYEPNRVTVRSSQNTEGMLVLLDSYFPGWKVKVDGEDGVLYRANHFFRAVKLGPGNHEVEFRFEPVGFRAGMAISVTTLSLMFIFAVCSCFLKRKEK